MVSVKSPPPANTFVGEMLLIEGVGLAGVTVNDSVVLWLVLPEFTVIVSTKVPVAAVRDAEKVSFEVATPPGDGVTLVGENEAVTPLGTPETLRPVAPLKPFRLVTVMLVDPDPVWTTLGVPAERLMAKSGLGLTGKLADAEAPPPGVGLTTVTASVPAVATSLAGILAVSCEALPKVVVRLELFTCTTELRTKFFPLIVRVAAPPPAVALGGGRLVILGTGLRTAKFAVAVPPPGPPLTTVIGILPAEATSAG